MRVLIFHGYLLRGTGSNIYNASLARALAELGHDVHLLCQEHEADSLPWIGAVGRWRDGALTVAPAAAGAEGGAGGSITAYLPPIGRLLPVYVADEYEGFDARPFPELTEAEVRSYVDANVSAVADVAARLGGIDAALANHLIMGPAILARSGLGFAAKVHGSALSYTVAPHPRFLPWAREGIAAARAVLVGSRHTASALWETLGDSELPAKTRLGPPGVDVRAFAPLAAGERPERLLTALAARVEDAGRGELGRDGAAAAAALRGYAGAPGPRIAFVGKLLPGKGCDLLLAAWPLVRRAHPGARLALIGFGTAREGLLRLWGALASGDLSAARRLAETGLGESGAGSYRYLRAFLADPPPGYAEAARAARGSVELTGRLEHAEVAVAVRASSALVVPSTFPEAFGMVAAEAAAAGVLPVCAGHSGLAEVAAALAGDLPAAARGLTSFPLGPGAVAALAARLDGWLALPVAERTAARAALAATVARRWSWSEVARSVLAASAGRLGELAQVPSS